ncbi:MAG: nucleotidyltransferase domain-containing protein, partial [Magnetococcales bacterium]|nr:nucleotidyltransferase domain-containing protein [Magnetococcales bacterium]
MTITEAKLTTMSGRIVETIHPERIILFGSHARGEAGPHSDVDLLVITTETYGPHNCSASVGIGQLPSFYKLHTMATKRRNDPWKKSAEDIPLRKRRP